MEDSMKFRFRQLNIISIISNYFHHRYLNLQGYAILHPHSTHFHTSIDSVIQPNQIGTANHTKGFPNLWEINCVEFSQSAHRINLASST